MTSLFIKLFSSFSYSFFFSSSFSPPHIYHSIATEGVDYVSVKGSVTFSPNDTTQSFTINILNDDIPEIGEYFYILLTNATLVGDPGNNLGNDG